MPLNSAVRGLKVSAPESISRIGFFRGMAVLFLMITAAGFARTLYLRPLFDVPPLPVTFYVHGSFTTLWVVLFCVQAFLIANKRIAVHRQMGIVGALVAIGVVGSGLAILHYVAVEYPQQGATLDQIAPLIWGNIAGLIAYSIFVGVGISLRSRAQFHKRLMLMATLTMMGQPLARIGHFDAFRLSDSLIVNDAIYGLGGVVLLYVMVMIHDVWLSGRPHSTIVWGMPLHLGLMIVAGLVISGSEFGQSLILLVT